MSKITQYPLSVTRELSAWFLGVNPKLANLMIQGGGLSYPTDMSDDMPKTREFSINFNQDCDDCFKNALQKYEDRLKYLSGLSDTLNDLADLDYWNYFLECMYTFIAYIGGADIILAIGEAIKDLGLTAQEAEQINALLQRIKDHLKKALTGAVTDQVTENTVYNLNKQIENCRSFLRSGGQIFDSWEDLDRSRPKDLKAEIEKCRRLIAKSISDQTRTSKALRGIQDALNELFYALQAILRRNGMGLLRFLGIVLGKSFKYILGIITLYFVWDILKKYLDKMNERCVKNQEDQRDINAARYAAADEYYRALGECLQRGCCDDPIACKGIGGWCTRFRNGVDFTYYTPCCSGCDCGGDPDCYEALCTTCDPNRKCPDTDGGEPIDTPAQRDSLPNYLFPSTKSTKVGCPPLPPGWQRLPDGVTPDARSSPEWDITPIPDCIVQDIENFLYNLWRSLGGGSSGGGTTTTAAD